MGIWPFPEAQNMAVFTTVQVVELADLPIGWVATRSDAQAKWSRSKNLEF